MKQTQPPNHQATLQLHIILYGVIWCNITLNSL